MKGEFISFLSLITPIGYYCIQKDSCPRLKRCQNLPRIRVRHITGTAHLLDGPSINPSMHLWAQHRARQYLYPFSIRPFTLSDAQAQQPHVRPRKNPARARRPARRVTRGLELEISTIYYENDALFSQTDIRIGFWTPRNPINIKIACRSTTPFCIQIKNIKFILR